MFRLSTKTLMLLALVMATASATFCGYCGREIKIGEEWKCPGPQCKGDMHYECYLNDIGECFDKCSGCRGRRRAADIVATTKYRPLPVLERLLEEIREANRVHRAS